MPCHVHRMALWLYPWTHSTASCQISSKKKKNNFEEVSDSPQETMKDKVARAGAEAIKKRVWL